MVCLKGNLVKAHKLIEWRADDSLLQSLYKDTVDIGSDEIGNSLFQDGNLKPDEPLLFISDNETPDSNDEDEQQEQTDKDNENIKEILLDSYNYNNNFDFGKPNFYRRHRYDIKKPGPRYLEEYFVTDDDSNDSQVESTGSGDEKNMMDGTNHQDLFESGKQNSFWLGSYNRITRQCKKRATKSPMWTWCRWSPSRRAQWKWREKWPTTWSFARPTRESQPIWRQSTRRTPT